MKPEGYDENISSGMTHKWVNKFKTNFHTIELSIDDTRWFTEAEKAGTITGRFPKQWSEELNEFLDKYDHKTRHLFDDTTCGIGWFVRTESVSLKTGCHGIGPSKI